MVLSGALLLGLLAFNLWRTAAASAERAELDARRQVHLTSVALRRAIRDSRFLDTVPEDLCFVVRGGVLVAPTAVGWIHRPPTPPSRETLDELTRSKLADLERGLPESVDGQEEVLRSLVDSARRPRPQQDWVRVYAGFWAHRQGRASWCGELLADLANRAGGATPLAAASLAVRHFGRLPRWAEERLATLPSARLDPFLARLLESDGPDSAGLRKGATRLRDAHAICLARRAWLVAVDADLPELHESGASSVAVRGHLLCWREAEGERRGARVPGARLLDILQQLVREEWVAAPDTSLAAVSLSLVERETKGPLHDAALAVGQPGLEVLVPELLVARPRPVSSLGTVGVWVPAFVVGVLICIALAGLLVFHRTARRQTMAAEARAEFLTMVTHELKTPLAGIRLIAEMLEAGHVSGGKQRREYHNRLSRESERLSLLIENVLDLGRLDRGERVLQRLPEDLGELVSDAVDVFEPIATAHGMRLVWRQPTTEVPVAVDRHALLQALINVMDNARKYAVAGKQLDVGVGDSVAGCARILIRDYGPGIPAAERDSMFARFQRGAAHAHGSVPGVGLGLHLARSILVQFGGDLLVEDPVDGGPGVCFIFSLPRRDVGNSPDENPRPPRDRAPVLPDPGVDSDRP